MLSKDNKRPERRQPRPNSLPHRAQPPRPRFSIPTTTTNTRTLLARISHPEISSSQPHRANRELRSQPPPTPCTRDTLRAPPPYLLPTTTTTRPPHDIRNPRPHLAIDPVIPRLWRPRGRGRLSRRSRSRACAARPACLCPCPCPFPFPGPGLANPCRHQPVADRRRPRGRRRLWPGCGC